MFFIFSKILLFLTYPFTWILLCLIGAIVWRKKGFSRKLLIATFTLFLFFSNTVIFCEFVRHWEVEGKKIDTLPNYDCAIVLTGMAFYNNDLNRISLNRNGDRIWQALDLYHKGKVKKILISGDSGHISDRGLHEAKQLAETIKGWGIPVEDILVEDRSQNTHENAVFSARMLKSKHPQLRSFLLVTSAMHMKRSLACFQKQNLSCIPFSTNHNTGPKRAYYLEQFVLPNAEILSKWEMLTKEGVGYIMYWMAGYL